MLKCVPRVARLGQCLRRYHDGNGEPHLQLIDASKFALATAQAFSYAAWRINGETKAWTAFYIAISVVEAIAQAAWDIRCDWNLGHPKCTSIGMRVR